jgi:hypothetical protein
LNQVKPLFLRTGEKERLTLEKAQSTKLVHGETNESDRTRYGAAIQPEVAALHLSGDG